MRLHETIETGSETDVVAYNQTAFESEEALENQLYRNPQLLLDERVFLIGRQVRLDTGIADLVGLDRFGNVIIFEVKMGRSGSGSASEETILSQPQNYAQSLSSFDYDGLNELYQEHQKRRGRGDQDISESFVGGGNLLSGFEAVFGDGLEEHQFNSTQRMVVVAEKITRRTEMNARYLLEQGLNFQCVAIQAFRSPREKQDGMMFTSSVVVDYDLKRFRSKSRPSPTYPELTAAIIESIFSDIQSTVRAETLRDVFPDNFDTRTPVLKSNHPDHPDGVIYYISPKPDMNEITIGLHNMNENPAIGEAILREKSRFEKAGLTVQDNLRYNLLTRDWHVKSAEEVRDLADEIGEAYASMVSLGHEMLLADNHGDTE